MSTQASVQTMATPTFTPVASGMLQRCTATTECDECRKKREGTLQRATVNSSPIQEVPPIVHEVLRSPGQPLDPQTRSFMEPRFGHEFSKVSLRGSGPTVLPNTLSVGQPNTPFEHEADQIAKQVMDIQSSPSFENRNSCDFSGVRIHNDAKAAQSAHALNALAYTVGNHIVFANGQPSSHSNDQQLLAHELSHVIQQSNSHQFGKPAIQRFRSFSAAKQASGESLGWKHPASKTLRVSDDGQMAVENNGWGAGRTKRAWTTPTLMSDANAILAKQGSHAKLITKAGGTDISGQAPETGDPSMLTEIEPAKAVGAGVFDLISDCGHACRQVMGSGPAGKDVAVIKKQPSGKTGGILGAIGGGLVGGALGAGLGFLAGGPIGALIGGVLGAVGGGIGGWYAGKAIEKASAKPREEHLAPRTYHGGDPTTPEEWSEELFKKEFGNGLTRAEAYARYAALSPAEKDAFDRKYGINKYAVPRVGQGLTVSTEKDMPGYSTAPGAFTWNFHYAAAVLASGHDFVTLESARGWGATEWIFFMYGPETKHQSFYEFHGGTGTHGSRWSTYVVQPEHANP
jgi:hypothetical protein